jgi:hypothetical protein
MKRKIKAGRNTAPLWNLTFLRRNDLPYCPPSFVPREGGEERILKN